MILPNAPSMALVQDGTLLPTPGTGTEGTDGGPAAAPSFFSPMTTFLLIGLVLWFLIFAPEKKARKKRQALLASIKKGDKIVTSGGLHGEVAEVRDHEVVIKAGDARFVYSRSAINEIIGADDSKD